MKDELLAGGKPCPRNNEGAVTVELVVNALMTYKERLCDKTKSSHVRESLASFDGGHCKF